MAIAFYLYVFLIVNLWFWVFSWVSKKNLLGLVLFGDAILYSLLIFGSLPDDLIFKITGRKPDIGDSVVLVLLLVLFAFPKLYTLWLLFKYRAFKLLLLDAVLLTIIIAFLYVISSM